MIRDIVIKNRSYRGFDGNVKIPHRTLVSFVDTARLVASGANVQPLKYQIADSQEKVGKLNALTKWAKMLKGVELPHKGMEPTSYIVIYVDSNINPNADAAKTDVGIAAQTILLSAVEEGFGGCMLGNFNKADVTSAMGADESLVPALVIALGKPAETVKLVDVGADGKTAYYRDENDVHFVPKRQLDDILLT